jgi:hypothetical protein
VVKPAEKAENILREKEEDGNQVKSQDCEQEAKSIALGSAKHPARGLPEGKLVNKVPKYYKGYRHKKIMNPGIAGGRFKGLKGVKTKYKVNYRKKDPTKHCSVFTNISF